MHPIQLSALIATVALPLGLWLAHRSRRSPAFDLAVRRTLAGLLVALEHGNQGVKFLEGAPEPLPMHLCDWALVAVAAALWFRSQAAFEPGYFWALAGTFQALLTPAIDFTLPAWRLGIFFYSHALIIIGVLQLLLVERLRPWPRSLPRVVLWSEVFLATALLANALTGANYGFLAHQPAQASLLDLFSDTHWLYVAQINLIAFAFFAALYLPWWIHDLTRSRAAAPTLPA